MAANPVTPIQGLATQIVTGLTAIAVANGTAINGGPINGGILTNPASNSDQGIVNAESLYVDPVGNCAPIGGVLKSGGTIYEITPGSTWNLIPGQTTATMVNATTAGHRFSITIW